MLELQNVKKTFFAGTANEKKALRGVSFTLDDGDFCTVIGSNGAGKSTTLNAIAGVFPIDSGSIKIDGVEISKMPEWKRASMIGRVFQDPMRGTAAGMMISENLAVADRRGRRPTLRWSDRADRNARFADIDNGLDFIGQRTQICSLFACNHFLSAYSTNSNSKPAMMTVSPSLAPFSRSAAMMPCFSSCSPK